MQLIIIIITIFQNQIKITGYLYEELGFHQGLQESRINSNQAINKQNHLPCVDSRENVETKVMNVLPMIW